MFRTIDDRITVSPQISTDDVAEAASRGFVMIINNRPDGEEPGQPSGEAIRAAAEAAGLAYRAVPITPAGIGEPQVAAMGAALAEAQGPVLAFCRSGTRSTNAWALARGRAGDDPDRLIASAANAGYDISGLRPYLGK